MSILGHYSVERHDIKDIFFNRATRASDREQGTDASIIYNLILKKVQHHDLLPNFSTFFRMICSRTPIIFPGTKSSIHFFIRNKISHKIVFTKGLLLIRDYLFCW